LSAVEVNTKSHCPETEVKESATAKRKEKSAFMVEMFWNTKKPLNASAEKNK
jgi:hypothetical protein